MDEEKEKIWVVNRETQLPQEELIFAEPFIRFLYHKNTFIYSLSYPIRLLVNCLPIFSRVYGFFQTLPFSKRKINPFIKKFSIKEEEFELDKKEFKSFNDFFIRKLKKEARPINPDETVAIIPADGRYLVFQDLRDSDGYYIKGQKFDLAKLLLDESLSKQYSDGSIVLGRLCPMDYHYFHFPFDCTPTDSKLINGYYAATNAFSLKRNIEIFSENKRIITTLESKRFGKVLFIEIGATAVATINNTFLPHKEYRKGDRKGYFSFGGSALVLLFQKGKIEFDEDLKEWSNKNMEVLCKMGQSLGKCQ